jgi:hypothetical protein
MRLDNTRAFDKLSHFYTSNNTIIVTKSKTAACATHGRDDTFIHWFLLENLKMRHLNTDG